MRSILGPLMVRGDLSGSILQGRLGGIWLVATQDTQHRVAGGRRMGEPNWGSQGLWRQPLNKILERNILGIFLIRHGILYMHADGHLTSYIRVVPPKPCIIYNEFEPSSPSPRICLDHHLSSIVGAHEWTMPSFVTKF